MLTTRAALRTITLVLACLILPVSHAQPPIEELKANLANASYEQKFASGVALMQDGFYAQAKVIWEDIIKDKPDNANINYKLATCIIKVGEPVEKALPYFEVAARNIVKNYNPYSQFEKGAPREVHYYMGYSAHRKGEVDKAEDEYLLFLDLAPKKHVLRPNAEMGLAQIKVAKELLANPKDYTIVNLGETVNTEYDEYSPVITLDGRTMFFTSKRTRPDASNKDIFSPQDGKHYEDIYMAIRNAEGAWMSPELLNLSTLDRNEATVSSNVDGSEIFIYISDPVAGSNVYTSVLYDTIFSSPDMIDRPINSENWEPHVTMSADGSLVFFTSDRPGGLGGRDIYRIKKMANGQWTDPLNLGAPINTPYDEDSPFIGADGKTLYFASNGPKSMGGFDMFVTQIDEEGQWSTPTNMGAPLNTFDDDIFYTTTADGYTGFYASNKEGGFGGTDLYMVLLRESLISGVAILKGYVRINTGEPIPQGIEIYLTNLSQGDQTRVFRPKMRDGSYVLNLTPCEQFLAEYKLNGKVFYSAEIDVPCNAAYHEINKEIYLDLLTLEGTSKGFEVTYNPMTTKHWEIRYLDKTQEFNGLRIEVTEDGMIVFDEDVINRFGQFQIGDIDEEKAYFLKAFQGDEQVCKGLELVQVDGNGAVLNQIPMDDKDCGFHLTKKRLVETAVWDSPKFETHFGYNENKIQADRDFETFMSAVKERVASGQKVTINVEASASRVPTSKFGNNQTLAQLRADKTKDKIQSWLRTSGVNQDLVSIESKALVQGPEYKNDHKKNLRVYVKYQYVKLSAD